MLTDPYVETYVEENIPPLQNVRRLANGSIDYIFYDKRARNDRGAAFRTAGRTVKAFGLRLFDVFVSGRAERQRIGEPKAEQLQAHRRPRRDFNRIETATASRKPYSQAA